jgi:hypothetical protein
MEAPQVSGTPLLGGRAIKRNDTAAGRSIRRLRSRVDITGISERNADKGCLCVIRAEKIRAEKILEETHDSGDRNLRNESTCVKIKGEQRTV